MARSFKLVGAREKEHYALSKIPRTTFTGG